MKIKYEVTVKDLEECSVFFVLRHKQGRRRITIAKIFFSAIPFILLWALGVDNPHLEIWSSPMYLGGAVLVSVGLVLIVSLYMKWIAKAVIRRMYVKDYKGILGWQERVLSDKGIEAASEVANGLTSWEGIEEVYFFKNYTYIFLGPNQAWVIPKDRIIEGDYDVFAEELKHLFEKNRPGMKVETLPA